MADGNTNNKELEKELDDLYVCLGGGIPKDELDAILNRIWEIEAILTPPLPRYEPPIDCNCGRGDCWECVYKDDPMGI